MSKGASKEELLSVSRGRGLLFEIVVSDIVKAAGKHLEEFSTARTLSREHSPKYNFPKEAITQDTWTKWLQFWEQQTVGNFEFATPLGEWIHPTYRVCERYYNQEGPSIQKHTPP